MILQKSKQKIKLLTLIDIFNKKTDDEHPLTATQLCQELKKHDIVAERKSIYNDIEVLIQYGFDINKAQNPKQGFYLATREFEFPEIRLLIDAVSTAPFITQKKTEELVLKLKSMVSGYQAEQITNQINAKNRVKYQNEEIYYNIDSIHRAIEYNKKVRFIYYHRKIINGRALFDKGKKVTVSPYALVWSNDRYYLIANNKNYESVSNYRLDRMKSIDILNEDVRPYAEITEYTTDFDVADYLKKSVNMFYGKQNKIELLCKKEFIEIIVDKFGTNISLYNKGKSNFLAIINVYLSDGLIEWLMQHGDMVFVQSPECLREKILEKIKNIHKTYDDINLEKILQ